MDNEAKNKDDTVNNSIASHNDTSFASLVKSPRSDSNPQRYLTIPKKAPVSVVPVPEWASTTSQEDLLEANV